MFHEGIKRFCLNLKTGENSLYPKIKTENPVLAEPKFLPTKKSQEKSPTQENPLLKIKNWAIGLATVACIGLGGSGKIIEQHIPAEVQPQNRQEQLANLKASQAETSVEQNNQILDSLQNQIQEIIKASLSLESFNGKNPTEQFQILQRNIAKILGLLNTILLVWKAYNIKEYGRTVSKENSSIQIQGRDVAENVLIWLAKAFKRFLTDPSLPNFALLFDAILDSVKSMIGLLKVATNGKSGENPNFGVIKEFLTADINLPKVNMQEIGQSVAEFQATYPGEIAQLVKELTQNPDAVKNLLKGTTKKSQELLETTAKKFQEFLPKDLEGKIDLAGSISLLIAFLFLPSSVAIILSNTLEMYSNFMLLKDKNGPGFGYKAQEGLFNLGSAVSDDPLYSFVGISQLLVQLAASATKRIDNRVAEYFQTNFDKLKKLVTAQILATQINRQDQFNLKREFITRQEVSYTQTATSPELLQRLSRLKNQNLN